MKKGLAVVLSLMMVLGILPFGLIRNNIAEAAAGDKYTLVTDASTLAAGDELIIAAVDYDVALSTTQNGNNRGQASITKSDDNTCTFGSDVEILTLETGNVEGTFAFKAAGGYLYAASSSSNYLRTEATLSNNSSWKIEIDAGNGSATIKAQGSYTRNLMRYNSSSRLFACYASGQQDICIYRLASSSSTETATPAPEVTATPTPEVSTDDYSGTYYIATKRSSGNYFYMTNNLGTASTKRYQAVDSGLTELPAVIENADAVKTFTLSKTADGYTITDSNGKYLAHKTDNSGILQDGAFNVTVDLADGTFNIHYTASDAERYLSLNGTSGNNYFAWYKSGQRSALSLIPVTGTASTPTPTPVVTPTPTPVVTATPTPSGDGRSFQLVTDLSGITDGSYVIVAVNEYGKATVTNVFGALTRQLVESSWVVSTSADSFMGSDASSIPTNITVNNDLLVWALAGDSSGVTLTAEDASGVLRNSSNNLYYDSGTASTYTIQVSKTGLQNAFNIVNDTRILAWRLTLSDSVSYDRYRFAASSNNPTGGYCSNLYFYKEVAADSCVVTFKDADGTILGTQTVQKGSTLTSSLPDIYTPTNHAFKGWMDEATGTIYSALDVALTHFSVNTTFIAVYERTHVTVSFSATNGGTLSSTTALKVAINSTLTSAQLPTPTANEHYSFTGWTVNGTTVTPTSYTLTEDTTFVANFKLDSYSVLFKDMNGNQLSMQAVDYGSYMNVPTPPTVPGYTFIGWTDGSKVYSSNELRYLIIEESKTYTAVYQSSSYRVTFAASEGGTISTANTYTVQFGNTISSAGITFPTATANAGYSFAGWLINGTLYSSAEAAGAVEINSDLTIVAQFYADEITITFADSNGTVLKSETIPSGANVTAPAEPTLEGHTFAGWSDGTNVYTSAQINATSFTATTTFTAVQQPIQYTVTFVSDGVTVATQTVNYASTAALPIQPTVEGKTFIGWAVDGTVVDVDSYVITENTTFVAQFSDTLVEEYVTNNGNFGMPDSIGYTVTGSQPVQQVAYRRTTTPVQGNYYVIAAQYNGTWYAISNNPYDKTSLAGGLRPVEMTLNGDILTLADSSATANDIEWMWVGITNEGYTDYHALRSHDSEYLAYYQPDGQSYKWLSIDTSLYTSALWQYNYSTKRLVNYTTTTYGISWNTSQNTFDYYNNQLDVYFFEKTTISVEAVASTDYSVEMFGPAGDSISQIYVYGTEITESGTYQPTATLTSAFASDTSCYWYSTNPEVATVDQNGLVTYTGKAGTSVIAVLAPFTVDGITYYARDFFMISISNDASLYPLEDTDDLVNFPEFPDEGSVRIDKKVVDTSIYDSTGVAEIELSIAGIPYSAPVDVVLVIDASNTMEGTDGDGVTRLTEAKNSATEFVDTLLVADDGSFTDHRVAVVAFGTGGTIVQSMTGATTDAELTAIHDAINGIAVSGATNYDAGLAAANMVLTQAASDDVGNGRKQYVIFMTDGAPNCFNRLSVSQLPTDSTSSFAFTMPDGATLQYLRTLMADNFDYWSFKTDTRWTALEAGTATSYTPAAYEYWKRWTTGTLDDGELEFGYLYNNSIVTTATILPSIANYHFADNIYAALTKGTLTADQIDAMGFANSVSSRNATIYTVGFGLSNGANVISFSQSGTTVASIDFTAAECAAVLENIASSSECSLNADNAEELSAAYQEIAESILMAASDAVVTDVMGPEFDLQFATTVPNEDGGRDSISITPTVEVGYWVLDEVTRERVYYTMMEKFTFTTDASGKITAVNSDVVGSCYDATNNAFVGQYLEYDFDTETFQYKFDIDGELEMTLKYWVYLTGTMEGTRPAGVYDTNEYAKLRYVNYNGWNCQLTFPVPKLPWGAAIVQYSYYLVDEDGNPINTNGTIVPFAERIIVGSTYTHEFALNSTQNIYAIANIPTGYAPYNGAASYQVLASNGGTMGSAIITDATGTTYMIAPITTNQTGTNIGIDNYSYTHVLFAVVSTDSKDLAFTALGAQAHMIHKNRYLNTAALYTDGIRFGIEVKLSDMQKSLNPGEYFAFGLMMQPTHKLVGLTDATAYNVNTHLDSISRFTPTIDASGSLYVGNGSVVFSSRSDAVMATRSVVNGRSHYTIDPTTMIRWTDDMENAATAEELVTLLRAAGCTIFSLNEDGSGFRYVTKLMFSSEEEQRAAQASTEITYGGLFVKLNSDGEYVLNTTLQKTNSAQRIFAHYNYAGYQIGTEASLNGWSLYGPSLEVQAGWN